MYYKGVGLPSYIEWEVVRMKFNFQDLMAFGMFILALLTFIVLIRQQRFSSPGNRHRKTTLVYFGRVRRAEFLSFLPANPLWAAVPL